MCRLMLWSPALSFTSRTSTSPTMAPIAVWRPMLWERHTTTTSSMYTVGIIPQYTDQTSCWISPFSPGFNFYCWCTDLTAYNSFGSRGIVFALIRIYYSICTTNRFTVIYGCKPLLRGTRGLKPQKCGCSWQIHSATNLCWRFELPLYY